MQFSTFNVSYYTSYPTYVTFSIFRLSSVFRVYKQTINETLVIEDNEANFTAMINALASYM